MAGTAATTFGRERIAKPTQAPTIGARPRPVISSSASKRNNCAQICARNHVVPMMAPNQLTVPNA
jgi:hypothetical protein